MLGVSHGGDGVLSTLPHPRASYRDKEKSQQEWWFSKEWKYSIFSSSFKRCLALNTEGCEGKHPPAALFNPLLVMEQIKSNNKGTRRAGDALL